MRAIKVIKLCLSFSGGLGLMLGLLLAGAKPPQAAAYAPPSAGEAMPNASFHLWDVNEIFSCADSSVQFVELINPTNAASETQLASKTLIATNLAGTLSHTFTFTKNLTSSTANKFLLIATVGFSNLSGGAIPDFTLPANFLFTEGGSVNFAGVDIFNYSAGQLPLDGINSLSQGGMTGVNSPRNFAGQQGSISCTPNLTLSKTADASGIVETGSLLTYTLAVANQGLAAATNGILTDTIPVSTTYVPNSASNGGGFAGGVVSWTNLTITPGTTITRTFQVTVSATITTGNKITNTAHITSAQGKGAAGSVVVTGGSQTGNKIYLPLILKN